jgi:hypothetical protein
MIVGCVASARAHRHALLLTTVSSRGRCFSRVRRPTVSITRSIHC